MRIMMWSGPRNISTAMTRAFENRADMAVWDEPFYAHYLAWTGLEHPMREAVIEAGETDWRAVARACTESPSAPNRHGRVPEHMFQKHITAHMLDHIPLDFIEGAAHFFLIRAPEASIASYHDRRAEPVMADLGFERQYSLFEQIGERMGQAPIVIDSERVLADPPGVMRRLCEKLGLPFDPAMLSWPAGPRDSDGVWAAHWYKSVERSTGFGPPKPPRPLPAHLEPLATECRVYYDRLAVGAL